MPRFAVKRMTKSDITIIARHYRARKSAGNTTAQKSIALPKKVFIDQIFPQLRFPWVREIPPFTMTVIGPSAAPPFEAAVSITKAAKNWRLNGFFKDPQNINDAWDIPDRFSGMLPPPGYENRDIEAFVSANNIAIIEFPAEAIPTSGRIAFVSRSIPGYRDLFERLEEFLGNQSMVKIAEDSLEKTFHLARIPGDDPIWNLTAGTQKNSLRPIKADNEAAALGVGEAIKRVRADQRVFGRRRVTAIQHAFWKAMAEDCGRRGETLAWHYLTDMESRREIRELVWSSATEDFYSPFDFRAFKGDAELFVEVKSTINEFNAPINMSIGELEAAAQGQGRYAIYRFYKVQPTRGLLRVCPDAREFAQRVLTSIKATQDLGVSVDKISFSPEIIGFEKQPTVVFLPEGLGDAEE